MPHRSFNLWFLKYCFLIGVLFLAPDFWSAPAWSSPPCSGDSKKACMKCSKTGGQWDKKKHMCVKKKPKGANSDLPPPPKAPPIKDMEDKFPDTKGDDL